MSNSSNTPGWLTPWSQGPEYDGALEALLADWIAGVSALAPDEVMVRREEEEAAPQGDNWCEYAVSEIARATSAAFSRQGEEQVTQRRDETVTCTLSFFGPNGQGIAARFLDGLLVSQNQDELRARGFAFGGHGALTGSSQQINNQWVKRYDVTLRLYRTVAREYGVMALTQAPVIFFTGE
ncbi:hypothetical protein GIX45_04075 [Erwinia sp. CPCC 100877]|nr:hypothetical protein [Erwinia sp. CPCC 100877]